MNLRLIPEAVEELREAFQYYKNIESGLGRRFLSEIGKSLRGIKEYPRAWSPHRHGTRRSHPRGFPYVIIYRLQRTQIDIIAIAHAARDPDYWADRLNN